MSPLLLLRGDDSVLLVVDMQTRFAAATPTDIWEHARDGAVLLARAAGELALPVLATQQVPDKLGPIHPDVAAALPDHTERIDKTCFAASGADEFMQALAMTGRRQAVVCGMETHVCVVQTVAGLAAAGYAPFVVADAVCSRESGHKDNALARMQAAGVPIINRESALFEWMRDAHHEKFKAVSALLK